MKSSLLFMLPILVFIALGNCGILGGEDKEPPIVWEEENINDYVVYSHSYGGDNLFIIDLETGEYELNSDYETIYSISVNKENTKLYLSTGKGQLFQNIGEVVEIDLSDWSSRVIYDRPVEFLLSDRDDVFFITLAERIDQSNFSPIRVLGRINNTDGNVEELSQINVAHAENHDYKNIQIHPYEGTVYALNNNYQLYRHSYLTKETTLLFDGLSFGNFPNTELSSGGDTLYFLGGPVFDLNDMREIGQLPVFKWGNPKARRDNREVYNTDTGNPYQSGSSILKVTVYDPSKNIVTDSIDVGGSTDLIFLTENERYAVTHVAQRFISIIDLKEKAIHKEIHFEPTEIPVVLGRIFLAKKSS
ncbi:MAG: hypothetical protein NXI08_14385 [bacterium]|nr:hypothetical protein [bacterium]